MWADDLPLNKFHQRVHAFDVVVSSMWFWNILGAKVGESLTIPIVVDSLIGDVTSISHVVVTDDIHYTDVLGSIEDFRSVKWLQSRRTVDIFAQFEGVYHSRRSHAYAQNTEDPHICE